MEALFTTWLNAQTAILALTGGIANSELTGRARIHWDALPQPGALPALIVHEQGGASDDYTFRGRVSLTENFLQLDCWAGTRAEAIALRVALTDALDTLREPPLQAFILRRHSGRDLITGPDANGVSAFHRASLDIRLWHDPSAT